MSIFTSWIFPALILLVSNSANAQIEKAPPSFPYKGHQAVPADISAVHVSYDFNAELKKVLATSTVKFKTGQLGYPIFDLKPAIKSLTLNGNIISPSEATLVKTPEGNSTVRIIERDVNANEEQTLSLSFELLATDVTFLKDTVRCGFFMSDLDRPDFGGLHFYERYGPANLEFDQINFSFDVKVSGTNVAHRVFTNGETLEIAKNQWSIKFPSYFTSSSIYFHIANADAFAIAEGVYEGLERTIPIVAYSGTQFGANSALRVTQEELQELESTFGPSLHKKYVIYSTQSFPGGMEHSGATITASNALSHELSHSWFARGIMPANGNAGWIDEAIASWRDDGYPAKDPTVGLSVNLGGYSPYRRSTPEIAYTQGEDLISELNVRFRAFGGMQTLLSDWFNQAKGTNVTTENFKTFLEAATNDNLSDIFKRRVYGKANVSFEKIVGPNKHPMPFTFEQYKSLR